MRAYYDRRAPEYDDWYRGTGLFADRDRPGWHEEVDQLVTLISSLRATPTLDLACGTGFLTRHLPGAIVGLDASPRMLQQVSHAVEGIAFVQGDALHLPFRDSAFQRVFTSHFYGHVLPPERENLIVQLHRVASETVIVDSAWREGLETEEWQPRTLSDGSTHKVYKRFFTPEGLEREFGPIEVLHFGRWFIAVRHVH